MTNQDEIIKKMQKEIDELKVSFSKMGTAGTAKKERKKPTNPKKNPFMEFGKEMRKKFQDDWKGKPAPEVAKLIGKLWQEEKKKSEDS